MQRPAHGSTTHPPLPRPGSGYGRVPRRGPDPEFWRRAERLETPERRQNDEGIDSAVR